MLKECLKHALLTMLLAYYLQHVLLLTGSKISWKNVEKVKVWLVESFWQLCSICSAFWPVLFASCPCVMARTAVSQNAAQWSGGRVTMGAQGRDRRVRDFPTNQSPGC